jgi:hypothetical protein
VLPCLRIIEIAKGEADRPAWRDRPRRSEGTGVTSSGGRTKMKRDLGALVDVPGEAARGGGSTGPDESKQPKGQATGDCPGWDRPQIQRQWLVVSKRLQRTGIPQESLSRHSPRRLPTWGTTYEKRPVPAAVGRAFSRPRHRRTGESGRWSTWLKLSASPGNPLATGKGPAPLTRVPPS